jgi:hypothetical protein
MKNIEMMQKLAILQCIYQMIVSSDNEVVGWRDNKAIDFALSELGLTSNFSWNSAINLNPHECFKIVAQLDPMSKYQFRDLLYKIADMGGNTVYRKNCAQQLLQLTGWK